MPATENLHINGSQYDVGDGSGPVNCNWPLCVDFPGRRRCNVTVQPYLDEKFLNRVRRAYRAAIAVSGDAGQVWAPIDSRRNDVHSALLHHQNDALRTIFADPTATDLYYGCDNLCRSITQVEPALFVEAALASGRGRYAARKAEQMAALLAKGSVSSVVEIGPGMGRAAFFAYRLGIIDYSTIDLPLGIAAQACFLARVLGPDKLWFDGEASELATGKVKLFCAGKLSFWTIRCRAQRRFYDRDALACGIRLRALARPACRLLSLDQSRPQSFYGR